MRRRRTIEIPGLRHPAPIPMACRVGDVLCTSAIMGADPESGELPDGAEQVTHAFANLRTVVEAGGASVDDVVSVQVLLADDALRDAVNAAWVAMFPDPDDRPARHTTRLELPGGMLVQLEAMAIV